MFTGIVQGIGTVQKIADKPGLRSFVVEVPSAIARGVKLGASVAVAGVCLTVTRARGKRLAFDAMQETLDRTTLGALRVGDAVNVERSARIGDEIGGHLVSGHVTGTAAVTAVEKPKNNRVMSFGVPADWMPYIFPKGFIALDGASLTVVDIFPNGFTVHLIPETLARTTFGARGIGDRVNLEIDSRTQAIVDTIRRLGARNKKIPRGRTGRIGGRRKEAGAGRT